MTASTAAWPDYLRTYHDTRPAITEELLRRCDPDPDAWLLDGVDVAGRRVLDLACGSAPLRPRLMDAEYVGVDVSPAELRAAASRGRGPLLLADASRLPVPDRSVDLVLCSMALQILTPLPAVLAELTRVLRPGGRLVAMIPVSRPLSYADRVRYSKIMWQLRRPRLGYANSRVPRRLARAGWTVRAQPARRFAYRLDAPADGRRLIDAFYLPGGTAAQHDAAVELVSRWSGVELGIPLQRLVATPLVAGRTIRSPERPPEGRCGGAGSQPMSELGHDVPGPASAPGGSSGGSDLPARLRVYSTIWCGSCIRLKRQLDRAGVEYDDVDLDRHDDAAAFVMSVNGGNRTVPTLLFPDGTTLTDPSVRDVLHHLGV